MNNLRFNYTSASFTAIIAALIAVAVTFGAHFTEDNTRSVLLLVGLIGGGLAGGGGAKSAALIHANVRVPEWLHFTSASVVSAAGAALALISSYVFHLTQENTQSLLLMVGLIASGMTVGGGVKSNALIMTGKHPALRTAKKRGTA